MHHRPSWALCAMTVLFCAAVVIANPYTLQRAGGLERLNDVNNHGLAVGGVWMDSVYQAAVWDPIAGTTFLPTPGDVNSSAVALNNHGAVVGYFTDASNNREAVLWTPGAGGYSYTLLGKFGKSHSIATDINDNGIIVGYSYTAMPRTAWYRRAEGTHVILPSVAGQDQNFAVGLNSSNTVGGHSYHTSGSDYSVWRWDDAGTSQPVPAVDVLHSSSIYAHARAIGETGNPVGGLNGPSSPSQMTIFTGSGPVNLGDIVPGEKKVAVAMNVNAIGRLVGYGRDAADQYRALMWQPTSPNAFTGTMYNLMNLMDSSGNDWELNHADGLNDHGQIVGYGKLDGAYAGYFLTPVGAVFPGKSVSAAGGGTGVVGGIVAGFEDVTSGGTLTSSNDVLTAAELAAMYAALPNDPPADAGFGVWEIGFDGEFEGSADISIRFDETLLDPSQGLVAYHWTGSAWEILPCTVNLEDFTATFTTTGFSPFVLAEVPEPATLSLLAIGGLALIRRKRN